VVPTKNNQKANFEWLPNGIVFMLGGGTESIPMKSESLEQFIYEHYGYTKITKTPPKNTNCSIQVGL
jgi:hypothetical protein